MSKLLQRRQLLLYFGLGIVGAGGVAALRSNFKKPNPLASSAPTTSVSAPPLPKRQPLIEFQGISQWLNSPPLTIADLNGSVVLLQFWTFGCNICQLTLPHVTRWDQQYAAQGLKVIGVHTPEFAYEREVNNIKSAVKRAQITYPVPIDNELQTWSAYRERFWPHLYLADRDGIVRYDYAGAGAYQETEQAIRTLLG